MKKKYFERCEVCDLDMNGYECSCWCKCGLPYYQCICDMSKEDWEKFSKK